MKRFLFTVCCCFPAWGVMAPLYENIREYQAILEDPLLLSYSNEQILSITKKGDLYVIETTSYLFFARIVRDPQRRPGPIEFHIVMHGPCTKGEEPVS